jgi:hypothetical protein
MKGTLAVILLAAASVVSANADAVNNAGFETGDFTGWSISGPAATLNGGPVSDPVTTNPQDGSQYVGVSAAIAPGVYVPNSGAFYAYFSGGAFNTTGTTMTEYYTLSQTINTTPLQAYTVSFYLANDTPADPTHGYYNEVTGTFGTGTGLALFDVPATADASTYTKYTFYGIATSESTTLTLNFDNPGYFDVDDVSVNAATPEPATLALIGPALGGLLYFARRRRKA